MATARDTTRARKMINSLQRVAVEALDQLNVGFIATDDAGRLLLTNSTAELILSTRDGLEVTSEGILSSTYGPLLNLMKTSGEMNTNVEAWPGNAQAHSRVFAVPRRAGRKSLTITVRRVVQVSSTLDRDETAALVFILDPELSTDASSAQLGQLYRLTSAEARLARLLMEGKTFDACCEELRVQPSTTRMHLCHLFAKTDVERQSQLVSLLFKSVGLVRMEPRIAMGNTGVLRCQPESEEL
jgi:DNA-binding CsgD family transcriptional regulator